MATCIGLIFTVTMAALPGILKGQGTIVPPPDPNIPGPVASDGRDQPSVEPLQPPSEPEIAINWDKVAVNESAGLAQNAAPLLPRSCYL